ncbi:uncharacterized protein PAC_17793 [Phialocephala subalpina]|uniref:Uncharacterized protein n=1 Tax=Phialocephala subalpina TaxID=576137 RepID=A0A1L7XS73_9HELO|nr:uncharacterized protein PAC_17793 [Phialocephala subalpina]
MSERQNQQKAVDQAQQNKELFPLDDVRSPDFIFLDTGSVESPDAFCDLGAYSAFMDGINSMNMDLVSTSDFDPTSTRSPLSARSESVDHILSRFPCIDTRSHPSNSNDQGNNGGLQSDDLSSTEAEKARWLSPLHIAAQRGHDRVVRVLLQHHIDCNEKDSDGLTPLIHATIRGYDDVVNSLLLHGAGIGYVDNDHRSALHWAVIYRREGLLTILLKACKGERTLIDGYNKEGKTPLLMAVDAGFEAGVQILLELGANIHYKARISN